MTAFDETTFSAYSEQAPGGGGRPAAREALCSPEHGASSGQAFDVDAHPGRTRIRLTLMPARIQAHVIAPETVGWAFGTRTTPALAPPAPFDFTALRDDPASYHLRQRTGSKRRSELWRGAGGRRPVPRAVTPTLLSAYPPHDMKRLLPFLLIALLLATGCGNEGGSERPSDEGGDTSGLELRRWASSACAAFLKVPELEPILVEAISGTRTPDEGRINLATAYRGQTDHFDKALDEVSSLRPPALAQPAHDALIHLFEDSITMFTDLSARLSAGPMTAEQILSLVDVAQAEHELTQAALTAVFDEHPEGFDALAQAGCAE